MKAKQILSTSLIAFGMFMGASSGLFGQQAISGSFSSNGQTRSYLGAIPSQPQAFLRLVILFCGVGENASQMALREFDDFLGSNAMVVYPEPSSPAGFDNVNGVDDFQMVEDLIRTMDSIYPVDVNDICIGGFSNGGIFTYKLACDFNAVNGNRAYRFKSIAVVSGAMESGTASSTACPVLNDLPLIVFHGTQDPVIQYNGGQIQPPLNIPAEATETTVGFWANTNNSCSGNPTSTLLPDVVTESPNPSTVELLEYNCTSTMPTRFYRIIGGRHAWPGGNANIDNAQSKNLDINASELIAGFFNQTTASNVKDHLTESILQVYPNPFTGELSIEANFDVKKVVIVNAIGHTVYAAAQPQSLISLPHLATGLYFLTVEDALGRTFVRKVIKR